MKTYYVTGEVVAVNDKYGCFYVYSKELDDTGIAVELNFETDEDIKLRRKLDLKLNDRVKLKVTEFSYDDIDIEIVAKM